MELFSILSLKMALSRLLENLNIQTANNTLFVICKLNYQKKNDQFQ